MNRIPTIAAIVLTIASLAWSEAPSTPPQPVRVIDVVDGDTIGILIDSKRVRVRLEGIDAPERGQAFSTKAKERLSELMESGEVTAKFTGDDRYGRKLGRLFVTAPIAEVAAVGTVDVNVTLVRDGLAWHYKAYSDDHSLARAETAARRSRRGLWADEEPIAPWDYRKQSSAKKTPAK